MGDNCIEIWDHKYLDSMVGDNPVLSIITEFDNSWYESYPVDNYYVNEVRVGSIRLNDGKVLINRDIAHALVKLFNLNMDDAYLYFRTWIDKVEAGR